MLSCVRYNKKIRFINIVKNLSSIPGPVIMFKNEIPMVIGVTSKGHKCRLQCNIPEINVRVSSVLDWIHYNSLNGTCISETKFSEIPSYPLFIINYVCFILISAVVFFSNIGHLEIVEFTFLLISLNLFVLFLFE